MPRAIISPVDYSLNTIKGLQNIAGECPAHKWLIMLACEQDFKCLILFLFFLQCHAIFCKYIFYRGEQN